jgi:hypothetical protein
MGAGLARTPLVQRVAVVGVSATGGYPPTVGANVMYPD